MEKLIELLNEHRREKVNKQSGITQWHYNRYTFSLDNLKAQQAELLIISKQYGFIKWLVENEKIDEEKLGEKAERKPHYIFTTDDGRLGFKLFEVYESLLMLLSIQDEPIEFLVSILK